MLTKSVVKISQPNQIKLVFLTTLLKISYQKSTLEQYLYFVYILHMFGYLQLGRRLRVGCLMLCTGGNIYHIYHTHTFTNLLLLYNVESLILQLHRQCSYVCILGRMGCLMLCTWRNIYHMLGTLQYIHQSHTNTFTNILLLYNVESLWYYSCTACVHMFVYLAGWGA